MQSYSRTPHHCDACDKDDIIAKDWQNIETLNDKNSYGPGHVTTHISLTYLTRCVHICDLGMFWMCIRSTIILLLCAYYMEILLSPFLLCLLVYIYIWYSYIYIGVLKINHTMWRRCLITTGMRVVLSLIPSYIWSAINIHVWREIRLPILLHTRLKVDNFNMNFLLETGLTIKSLPIHPELLTGVLPIWLCRGIGMVYVLIPSGVQMLEIIFIPIFLMLIWKYNLPTKLCLRSAQPLGCRIILSYLIQTVSVLIPLPNYGLQ